MFSAQIPLWQGWKLITRLQCPTTQGCLWRGYSSTTTPNLEVSFEETAGLAIMRLRRKPVNSLSIDMLTDLLIALEKLENDKRCNGLIIASVFPKVFSAGLDLKELYQPKKDRLKELWRLGHEFWLRLYSSRLATAAAINGNSPAGGCVTALCCDYRVMAAGDFTIGLNETAVGIVPPTFVVGLMTNVAGMRECERALQLGKMFTSDEALRIGLVDDVVPPADVLDTAKRGLDRFLKVNGSVRELTKEMIRRPTVERMTTRKNQSIENMTEFCMKDSTQKLFASYLQSLKDKK